MILRNTPGAVFSAGATGLLYGVTDRVIPLPRNIITTKGIAELKTINKTERYIEIGSAVTMSEIADLGRNNIPHILHDALLAIGTSSIRNNATLAGNVLTTNHYLSLFAVLIALDAKIEIKTLSETTWKPLQQFAYDAVHATAAVTPTQIVTKIRIPLISSSVDVFEKIYKDKEARYPETFVMTADTPNNIITDIRLAYAGTTFFRFREIENALAGHTIPLTKRDSDKILDRAEEFMTAIEEPVSKHMLINLIKKNLNNLR